MNNTSMIGWKAKNYRAGSARFRCLNIVRRLRAEKFPVELYNERHENIYKAVVFSKGYKDSDIVIAQRLKQRGITVVFDLCDNHFLLAADRVARLRKMFDIADYWVVSSEALAKLVRRNFDTVKPLWIIEDAVEEALRGPALDVFGGLTAYYRLLQLRRFLNNGEAGRAAMHLVWFGVHKASYGDAGLVHMAKLRPLLEASCTQHPITLTVISDSREAFEGIFTGWNLPVHYVDWSPHTFFAALKLHDVAVIPIVVNEFTEVKTNNRIALSLNLGLGVLADSIPSYREFAQCAFLDDWERGLNEYIVNPDLVSEHSACGRKLISERFSGPVIASRWKELFESL